MKKLFLIAATGLLISAVGFAGFKSNDHEETPDPNQSKFSQLSDEAKADLIESINSDCTWNGIALHGKVEIVTSFPDIKVEMVDAFPDIKVKWVTSFPDDCGEWQEVTSFPDFKIQLVTSFPDIKVEEVTSFPGL